MPLIFCQEIAVLRPLECFFEKIEDNRPLKLKNNGGLLSDIFFSNAPFERYGGQGGLGLIPRFSKNAFWIVI